MLADLGYAVLEAASAERAIRLISDGQQVDVMVTDHLCLRLVIQSHTASLFRDWRAAGWKLMIRKC